MVTRAGAAKPISSDCEPRSGTGTTAKKSSMAEMTPSEMDSMLWVSR